MTCASLCRRNFLAMYSFASNKSGRSFENSLLDVHRYFEVLKVRVEENASLQFGHA